MSGLPVSPEGGSLISTGGFVSGRTAALNSLAVRNIFRATLQPRGGETAAAEPCGQELSTPTSRNLSSATAPRASPHLSSPALPLALPSIADSPPPRHSTQSSLPIVSPHSSKLSTALSPCSPHSPLIAHIFPFCPHSPIRSVSVCPSIFLLTIPFMLTLPHPPPLSLLIAISPFPPSYFLSFLTWIGSVSRLFLSVLLFLTNTPPCPPLPLPLLCSHRPPSLPLHPIFIFKPLTVPSSQPLLTSNTLSPTSLNLFSPSFLPSFYSFPSSAIPLPFFLSSHPFTHTCH